MQLPSFCDTLSAAVHVLRVISKGAYGNPPICLQFELGLQPAFGQHASDAQRRPRGGHQRTGRACRRGRQRAK